MTKLEFHKIIDQLSDLASSPGGQNLCRELMPDTDIQRIDHAQEETAAAFSRIIQKGRLSCSGSYPIEDSLKRLEINASLGSGELLRICKLLEATKRVKSYGFHDTTTEPADCLDDYFAQLNPLNSLCVEIRRCIPEEDVVSDDASPTLRSIRRNIGLTNEKVHGTLSSLLNGSLKSYLQDPIITMREDRYCLPIKSEYKAQVPGMVHDRSSSGSTLFIEPMAIIKLNNDLKELYGKEQTEIEVILSNLSNQTAAYVQELRTDYHTLTLLDFIFAKGMLALQMNASRPLLNTEGQLHIREGRHPLLDPGSVVPITVSLGETFDLLIITGPNTGGKTVSLKTVGLFTVMGQSGLHIPALDRSKLAVFDNVFADIGDEQSIEQSLSTFSSHMTNIVDFLGKIDENSLVLFDELGAGTDPTEGAALATAILSHLHGRGIRTMATTHYSELKVYALSTSGVENACCEFDVATLRPTYRLLMGIPGKSNAFAISGKLGLPDYIIEEAKTHLSSQDESFESMLGDLESQRKQLEKEEAAINTTRQELTALREKLDRQKDSLDSQRDRILQDARSEARDILQEAKEAADDTIKSMRKVSKNHLSESDLDRQREKLHHKLKKNAPQSDLGSNRKTPSPHNPEAFKLGESVKVLSMNLNGTVSSLPDARGNLFVQMGILRSQVNISDLELLDEPDIISPHLQHSGSGKMNLSKSLSVSPEINLLGKTVDEAVAELDKYLDDAYLSHLSPVRIVHGKGTGALRKGIHNYLKHVKYVKSYRLGEFGEGDAGVTIVEFKE